MPTPPQNPLCPCGSLKPYSSCCAIFHNGALPQTALQLMRSRYVAYALDLPGYIVKTTHHENPGYQSDKLNWLRELSQFSQATTFQKLEILDSQEEAQTATVTFRAQLLQNGRNATFTEKSVFEKVDGIWLYKSGKIN